MYAESTTIEVEEVPHTALTRHDTNVIGPSFVGGEDTRGMTWPWNG